jgi:hypothetical protein
MKRYPAIAVLVGMLSPCVPVQAEVLVRWSRDEIPSSAALGLGTVVVPATQPTAIRNAIAQGYRVYLEVEARALAKLVLPPASLAGIVVKGGPSSAQLADLERRMESRGARLLVLDERGKWPHIRSNWVTRNNEVLQVSGRSAQPWIENNAALFRILRTAERRRPPVLTYRWTPPTIATLAEAPRVEDYLVAIAEAGSFGGGLVLPLDEALQTSLLLGKPSARLEWTRIRQHLEFHAWSSPDHYRPVTNIGVVTADPMTSFEVMNLLVRHNLPFDLIAPLRLPAADLSGLDLLVVLDPPAGAWLDRLMGFARQGGTVVLADARGQSGAPDLPKPWRDGSRHSTSTDRVTHEVGAGRVTEMLQPIADPDRFALDMREILGRERRLLDIWNGITVLATVMEEPGGETLLVTALNYAVHPLPVQLRVRGTFSVVQYESPEAPPGLLSHTHREGYTEFVLPSLRTSARVFLSGRRAEQ